MDRFETTLSTVLFTISTPLGYVAVCGTTAGVTRVTFTSYPKNNHKPVSHKPLPSWAVVLRERLAEYLAGTARGDFTDIPVIYAESSTPFQRAVWEACRQIPHGQTLSYSQLATEIGNPQASRAVGTALAKNAHVLIVPCHRVIRRDGVVGHFSAGDGTATKARLLALEESLRK